MATHQTNHPNDTTKETILVNAKAYESYCVFRFGSKDGWEHSPLCQSVDRIFSYLSKIGVNMDDLRTTKSMQWRQRSSSHVWFVPSEQGYCVTMSGRETDWNEVMITISVASIDHKLCRVMLEEILNQGQVKAIIEDAIHEL
jgi:hypothetical protein